LAGCGASIKKGQGWVLQNVGVGASADASSGGSKGQKQRASALQADGSGGVAVSPTAIDGGGDSLGGQQRSADAPVVAGQVEGVGVLLTDRAIGGNVQVGSLEASGAASSVAVGKNVVVVGNAGIVGLQGELVDAGGANTGAVGSLAVGQSAVGNASAVGLQEEGVAGAGDTLVGVGTDFLAVGNHRSESLAGEGQLEGVESGGARGTGAEAGAVVGDAVLHLGVSGAGSGTQVEAGGVAGGADSRGRVGQAAVEGAGDAGGGTVGIGVEVVLGVACAADVGSGGGGADGVGGAVGDGGETLLLVSGDLEVVVAGQALISRGVGGLAVGDVDGVYSGGAGVVVEVLGDGALEASDGVGLVVVRDAVSDQLVSGDQGALGGTFKEVAAETAGAGGQRVVKLAGLNDGLGVGAAGLLSGQEEVGGAGGADVEGAGDQAVGIKDLLAALEGSPVRHGAADEAKDGGLDVEGVVLVVHEIQVLVGDVAGGAGLAVQERVGGASRNVGAGNAAVTGGVEQVARRAGETLAVVKVDVAVVNGFENGNTLTILDEEAFDAFDADLAASVELAVGHLLSRLNGDALLGGEVQVEV